MKGNVYVLRDDNNQLYIGSTTDIKRRLAQHKNGHSQATRHMNNVDLVLLQEYPTIGMARKIEKRIKNLKRKDYIERMILDGKIKMK